MISFLAWAFTTWPSGYTHSLIRKWHWFTIYPRIIGS